ncbi:PEP/pyruvate-binding domain-containing protein [Ktedonobacter racemifer]|uniref:Pyruvate phosphate dikinase PEP/pyruvate-binding n=1 Tax=Ktedonobacter racemifer DSM 44963 TaxID=485913 RepID=D6TS92_KTERA|nr:PEP/pyruvate-binding domain-containing protein [Ktedonobacter racemifer]EFH83293.1 pyruvate phosphate dikinase PEP/pyruvate-binding [Ktedonobacter racemifer DSM 44963]
MKDAATVPLVLAMDAEMALLEHVGGKGASLARLVKAGLPVPPGFHVTTEAYRCFVSENGLQEEILAAVATINSEQPATLEESAKRIGHLFMQGTMPKSIERAICQAYAELGGSQLAVAVRSSATAEDLPEQSFAGQQESYLNIRGEAAVVEAVKRCWASLWTARALGYRAHHAIAPEDVALAVVVQQLVNAEAAGIMFTANPLTGSREQVVINAAWGLGEAIVGGQVTPDTFIFEKASRAISEQQINDKRVMTVQTTTGTREEPVPGERRTQTALTPEQALELAQLGMRIEALYAQPTDVEWALHDGCFYIVQARPITTLHAHEARFEEWNDSLSGDYLWTNGNVGEAVPDVMTPCTWSLIKIFIADTMEPLHLTEHKPVGNIGGHFYLNLSITASLAALAGMNQKQFARISEGIFGRIPEGLEVPGLPLSRWRLLKALVPVAIRLKKRVRLNQKRLPAFIAAAPARCEELQAKIRNVVSSQELLALWRDEITPFFRECCHMLEAGARRDGNALALIRRDLGKLVDEEEANALFSGLSVGQNHLASLGLLLGLAQLERGEIDRETFARTYGHRGPHEFEVSLPRPAEDPTWIESQLAGLREAPLDVNALLARQKVVQAAAWERLRQRYPRKAAALRRRVDRAAAAAHDREAARSEIIRVFWVLRTFVLRVGELTGKGEDLFFLSIEEILALLGGDEVALATVPTRRATYERYSALPPLPALIRGHFDPFKWAADPRRRSDAFDERGQTVPASQTITGFPGAAGIVEGRARVVVSPEEGDQLQPGEILVTTQTNVGWTPLFPRAAAVVTDVGAPLSHAAIVARELGIPAVVGCGNATMRLHSGDWLRVDGGKGTVEVL